MKNMTISNTQNLIPFFAKEQFQKGVRVLLALCLAPLGTLGLMLVMHSLIQSELPEPEPEATINFSTIFEIPKENPPVEEPKLEPPSEVILPPEMMRVSKIDPSASNLFTGIEKTPVVEPNLDPWSNNSDSPIRVVAVAPIYPERATLREIEGYVDVQFDITKSGTTENIEIVAYHPSTVFNKAVVRAVSRWRYQPRIVDGESMPTERVIDRVVFELEE